MRRLRRQTGLLPKLTRSEISHSTPRSLLPTICNVHSHALSISSNSVSETNAPTLTVTLRSMPPAKCLKEPKVVSAELEILESRLDVLNVAISSYNCRTDLGKRQKKKLIKHTQEKATLETEIAALRTSGLKETAMKAINWTSSSIVHTQDEANLPPPEVRPLSSEHPQDFSRSLLALSIKHPHTSAQLVPSITKLATESSQFPSVSAAAAIERRHMHRDEIVPPSAASGGVPEPTLLYLSQCNMVPEFTAQPQHLLLVIDLNGTLLFRPNRSKPRHIVERPSTQEFLNYVMPNFSVMIWSSAQPGNVQHMCEKLFPGGSGQRLLGIWGRDRLGLSKEDSMRRVQVYKRLGSIWNDPQIQSSHPLASQGGCWHQGNTVLLDDSPEKSRSEPYNFVEIIEFKGGPEDPNILRDVAEYLATLRMQANVSSYIRQYPLRIVRGPPRAIYP